MNVFSLSKALTPLGKAAGDFRAAEEIVTKGDPVAGFEHGDLAGSYVDYVNGVFLNATLHGNGVFSKIRELAQKGHFHDRLFIPSSSPGASIIAENGSIPVGSYALSGKTLTPVKAGSIAVGSKESLQSEEGLNWLSSEMIQNITLAIDTRVCAILRAATTPVVSHFDPIVDLQLLVERVITTGASDPLLIINPAVARVLTFWTNGTAYPFFPKMGVLGGEIGGIPVIVTAGQAADAMSLVDCSKIITAQGDMQISTSENAMIEMDSTPAMDSGIPTGASGALVSAFQVDAIAVKTVMTFAISALLSSAVAVISGIDYIDYGASV
jgi:hypothetical protein